jgi:hypothetical protein
MYTQQAAELFFFVILLNGQFDLEFYDAGQEIIINANNAEKEAEEDDEAIVSDSAPI